MRVAIDWSHTKELTTYDGKKVRVETLKQLLSRISKDGGEPIDFVESKRGLQPPSTVLEQGCPMNLIYNLAKAGVQVSLIDNKATEHYRQEHNVEKTDENDAKIVWELSQNGVKLQPITVDDKMLQLHDVYHQYCRYQKARVALNNMRKAHKRQYGTGESRNRKWLQSMFSIHLVPDLSPYDIAIDVLEAREKSLLKKLEAIAKGLPLFETVDAESTFDVKSTPAIQVPSIKGLGKRIWLGIIVTANPANFKCLSAYLRFCGLTSDVIKSHKYNRHARMLYHMLAEEVMKQKDPSFRPIYDECKADIAEQWMVEHPIVETKIFKGRPVKFYTKGHLHNAALNRTATFLAKTIFYYTRREADGESNTGAKSILCLQPSVTQGWVVDTVDQVSKASDASVATQPLSNQIKTKKIVYCSDRSSASPVQKEEK